MFGIMFVEDLNFKQWEERQLELIKIQTKECVDHDKVSVFSASKQVENLLKPLNHVTYQRQSKYNSIQKWSEHQSENTITFGERFKEA